MMKMKNLFVSTIVFCSFFALNYQSVALETKDDKKVELSSVEKNSPVVLKGITKYDRVKWEQQEYIRKHYEGYHVVLRRVSFPKGKGSAFIQSFVLEDDDGKSVQVDFDITDAYNARNKKGNEELKALIKNIEKARKPLTAEEKKKLKAINSVANKIALEEVKKLGKKPEELTKEEWKKIDKIVQDAIKKESDNFFNSPK